MKRMHFGTVNILLVSLSLVLTYFTSIGYSALNASLSVSGSMSYSVDNDNTLFGMMRKNAKALDNTISLSADPTDTTSGIYEVYSTRNDTYPVYYYRGKVTNNNIKFANFCWKIVRTTSTGGVKLIYNGVPSSGTCNNTGTASHLGNRQFHTTHQGSTYITYVNTTIKTTLDSWYRNNLSSYASKIEDTIWCVDQTSHGDLYNEGKGTIYFGPYYRNFYRVSPNLECPNATDKYTVSTSKGNGKLTYPIGLLTADEVTLAGNGRTTSSGYLNIGQQWWLISPNAFAEVRDSYVFRISTEGSLDHNYVYLSYGSNALRPSISLVSGVTISGGAGTVSSPYTIVGG